MSSLPPSSLACTICSEYYKTTDDVLCTSCGHVYHAACFEDWKTRNMTCPDCRLSSPQTHKLFLHFEEHTEAERQLHQSKTELITKVLELERQLSESEANFMNALEAISAKDEEMKALNNEIEFRKAQNESFEHEINQLKQKLTSGKGFDDEIYSALQGLKISGIEKCFNLVDNAMEISPNGAVSLPLENEDINSEQIAEPTKSIFATKFAPDTTELEIKHYIQEKLPNLKDLIVFKFPAPSFRRVCSFRITVPVSFYDIIVQSNFWPEFTFVREFVERPQCVVTLPECETAEAL